MDPASSEDSSHPTSLETWEALSSHLHNLQISHELLESRVRVAEDRLLILSREQEGTASRLQWLEQFVAYLRSGVPSLRVRVLSLTCLPLLGLFPVLLHRLSLGCL